MHYIHKVGCTSVRQVPVTGTCSFRLITQIRKDSCLSETQIHRSSDLWVSHGYTCVDPQVTQTRAQPYSLGFLHGPQVVTSVLYKYEALPLKNIISFTTHNSLNPRNNLRLSA